MQQIQNALRVPYDY